MDGSMEEGLRLALRQTRDNRAEYSSEEDWACQVGALEGALGLLVALREWQEARRRWLIAISNKALQEDQRAAQGRLKRAEAALMKL